MKPPAIVGLDPGTTAGYVVLGLDGQVIKSAAAKNLPLAAIIAQVMDVCQPLLVGTDKVHVPSLVEEFSRKVGAVIVSPEQDLLREEKKALLNSSNYYDKNHHIQDSLAAALFAYKRYRPKLLKIEHFIKERHLEEIRGEFISLALKEDLPFSLLHDLLSRREEEPNRSLEQQIVRKVFSEQRITKKDFLLLLEKVTALSVKNASLQKRLDLSQQQQQQFQREKQYLEKKSCQADKKIDALFAFKENRLKVRQEELIRKQQQLESLRQKALSLYQFIAAIPQQQLVKRLLTLNKEDFAARRKILQLQPRDILWVENTAIYSEQVLRELAGQSLIIVSPQKISAPVQQKFLSFQWSGNVLQHNDYFLLLDKGAVEAQLAGRRVVERIVREYQQERGVQQERRIRA